MYLHISLHVFRGICGSLNRTLGNKTVIPCLIWIDSQLLSIDWLINYCFTSCSRIVHWYGDVTIAGEGLQNLGLCSSLRAFEQGGIFIVPHLLWHRTSVFQVPSEEPPVSSYEGMRRTFSNPDPHGVYPLIVETTRETVVLGRRS
jgi:hypothetical protein